MNPVTVKSIYGKTIKFEDDAMQTGRISVTVRDSSGEQVRNMIFTATELARLTAELAPVKSDKGVFFLLRQRVGNPLKVKTCFAGVTTTKEYTSRCEAERSAKSLNEQYGLKWNYFVVEKGAV